MLFAVVDSGQTVSGELDLRKIALRAIQVPTITSGDLFIQGNAVDQTSANYVRALETRSPGSGDLRFATGPGSKCLELPRGMLETLPFGRLETAVAQTNPRTFALVVEPRMRTAL